MFSPFVVVIDGNNMYSCGDMDLQVEMNSAPSESMRFSIIFAGNPLAL